MESAALNSLWIAVGWLLVLYLAVLGLVALSRPAAALSFLSAFARTWWLNFLEAAARGLAGAAFIGLDDQLGWSGVGRVLGIFLIGTAVAMLLLPGLHRRMAPALVRAAAPYIQLIGSASLIMAVTLAYALA